MLFWVLLSPNAGGVGDERGAYPLFRGHAPDAMGGMYWRITEDVARPCWVEGKTYEVCCIEGLSCFDEMFAPFGVKHTADPLNINFTFRECCIFDRAFVIPPEFVNELPQVSSSSLYDTLSRALSIFYPVDVDLFRLMTFIYKCIVPLPNGTALTIDLEIWKTMPGEAERACEEAQRDEHGVLAAWYVGFLDNSGSREGFTPPVYLEIGAGVGLWALLLALLLPDARIVAVEPNPLAVEYLRRNLKRHGVSNQVEALHAALTAETARQRVDVCSKE